MTTNSFRSGVNRGSDVLPPVCARLVMHEFQVRLVVVGRAAVVNAYRDGPCERRRGREVVIGRRVSELETGWWTR